MSTLGIVRVIGVAVILLLGLVGSISTPAGLMTVSFVFPILNTAFLFVLVTLGYDLMRRQGP